MTTVYLIRHGEAEGNYYRRVQGHWDGRITPLGSRQIDALARRMAAVPLDAVYSSDLTRAVTTAQGLLRDRDIPFRIAPQLREVCMGSWEGQSWGDVMYDDPEMYYAFNNDPGRWHVPGSEDWSCLQQRIRGALLRIAAENDGRTIAVVSHGTAIRALISLLQGVDSKDIHTVQHGDNTCVTLLRIQGEEIEMVYACDSSHLTGDLSTLGRQTWWRTGKDLGNLRFRPLDFAGESQFYVDCYADSWQRVHGNTDGFSPTLYLMAARQWQAQDARAVMVALEDETPVGIVAMDPRRGAEDGLGWIGFLYLLPQYRGQRYGPQLLGCAATHFVRLGRERMCLHVSRDNPEAMGFYLHVGFIPVGERQGAGAPLTVMEKSLDRGPLP